MTASISFYDSARLYATDGTGLLVAANAFKVGLVSSSYTFAASHALYSDITNELATANGYTSGGASLTTVTLTQATSTVTFDADDTVWTASGGSIVARRAFIYVNSTLNGHVKPLIASVLLDTTPADVTTTTGNTLTLQWNASGIITIT